MDYTTGFEFTQEEAKATCVQVLERHGQLLTQTYAEWRRGGSVSSVDEYHELFERHLRQINPAIKITRMIRKPFGFFLQLHHHQFTFTVSQDVVSYHERR